MKPTVLADFLSFAFQNKFTVLVKGKPGIGKSDIVRQAADSLGYDMYISHPVVSDPTDFKGLPFVSKDQESAEFLPFGDLKKLLEAKKPLVYFLDDLGQASASVQAACMQLLLARRINGHHVSEHVIFVAATNRREDKAGVQGMLEPVKSRFTSIVELDVDAEDWILWGVQNDMPSELLGFARFRPELFDKFEASKDMTNSASPRTYAHVGKLINSGLSKSLEFEVFKGSCGESFAVEFCAFLKVYRDLPSIDDILLNPTKTHVPTEPSSLYALSGALARKMSPQNIDAMMKYVDRIPDEFQVFVMKDALTRDKNVGRTKRFIQWSAENTDLLV